MGTLGVRPGPGASGDGRAGKAESSTPHTYLTSVCPHHSHLLKSQTHTSLLCLHTPSPAARAPPHLCRTCTQVSG